MSVARAFSLIETVCAVALFSGLALGVLQWERTCVAAVSVRSGSDHVWQSAAESALRLVTEDVHSRERSADGIQVDEMAGALRVLTRGKGWTHPIGDTVTHTYRLDGASLRLNERPLLGEVREWRVEQFASSGYLRLTLKSTRGAVVTREVRLEE